MDRIPYIVDYQHPTGTDRMWYRIYSDGWIEQGGTWTGTIEIAKGQEGGAIIIFPKVMADTNYYTNTSCVSTYCLPFRFIKNTNTCQYQFGAYEIARTLNTFVWEVKGLIDPTIMPPFFK